MGLQGYVGNAEDVRRIRRQEKQRESEKKKFEDMRKASAANIDAAGLRQFGAGASEAIETVFKNETIGLVTREEFVSKRATVQERFEEEVLKRKRQAEEDARQERLRQREKKAKLAAKSKLSFGEDDAEQEDEEEPAAAAASPSDAANGNHAQKVATLGKNPDVPTEFLRDRDRELLEEDMRRQLQKEYQLRQQVIKNEPLPITYSYWDGSGHRRKITVRKGDTISQFLQQVREQLSPEFREMRATSTSNLLYVKEDLIIPQTISFYDLIISQARGKSGPLFHFDVHDDIRVQHDATKEKDDSHAGKVVDRHWYNRNKHIFPANRWEMYEPA